MRWITANDLKAWAGRVDSRGNLPDLVKNLIRATAPGFGDYRFPVGESVQLPGFDGVLVDAKGAPPYVPDGNSVWEVSVESRPTGKATKVYDSRTADPGTIDQAKATFVFVTPRRWATKERWRNKHRAGPWAEVKVIDGVDLENWLELCPGVAAGFARFVLATMPEELLATEESWNRYAHRSQPALTEALLLAGRAEQAEALRNALAAGQAQALLVQGSSPDEALGFTVAAIRSAPEEVRRFIDARCLVVNDAEAALRIAHRGGFVLLVTASRSSAAGSFVASGNCVVVALGNQAPRQAQSVIQLPRTPAYLFAEAMVATMGVTPEEADRLARECASNVTILQRRRPAAYRREPDWCGAEASRRAMVPALLAGGWDAKNDEDRRMVGRLAGESYEAFEARLHDLLRADDSPVARLGSIWQLVAPADSFEFLAPSVRHPDLQALRDVALEVFSEIDPALDLAPDERPYAQLKGKTLRHSLALREGLAGALLLIAVRGGDASLLTGTDLQSFVNTLIESLPGLRANERLLASLGAQLPLLMEAAPGPFVAALEGLLSADASGPLGLFSESALIAPVSPHTPLLWGLEILAWNPDDLERISRVVAGLARVDRGGRLANRPIASLRSMFLIWHPATDAGLAVRLRALDALLVSEPEVGWKLLLSLLPQSRDIAWPAARPRWRAFGASKQQESREALDRAARAIAERALAKGGDDPVRWREIIGELHRMPSAVRSQLFDLLETKVQRGALAGERIGIWSALRSVAVRHRRFAAAPWALPAAELERLEGLIDRLQPDDLVERDRWLFDEHYPGFEVGQSPEVIDGRRRDAMWAVFERDGAEGILRLAQQARLPELVGAIAARHLGEQDIDPLLDADLEPTERGNAFVGGLSGEAARIYGRRWCEHLHRHAAEASWPAERIVAALLQWPDGARTWDDVAAQGGDVETQYWSLKAALRLKGPPDEVVRAVQRYAGVGRYTDAIATCAERFDEMPPELLLGLLDGALIEVGRSGLRENGSFPYFLPKVFEVLSRQAEIPQIEIARREFSWLPLLEDREYRLVLHQVLGSEPRFFVELLCEIYQPRPRERDEEISKERQARAVQAYRLLKSWTTLPGTQADGSLDYDQLRAWIEAARLGAAATSRGEVGETHIGQLLAHAPPDEEDDAWPARPMRNLIESLASEAVESGIRSERVSMRGVVWKGAYEGGDQERKAAEQARRWAAATAEWPRTARLLRGVAEFWESYGRREDERVEVEKLRGR